MFLSIKYNVLNIYARWNIADYYAFFDKEEIINAWNDPCIIHYVGKDKPWDVPNVFLGEFWWQFCNNFEKLISYFYKRIDNNFICRLIFQNRIIYSEFTTKKIPKYFDIKRKKNVVVYGAGIRARAILKYLFYLGVDVKFVIVSNPENNPEMVFGKRIIGVEKVGDMLKECTIIVATLEKTQPEILNILAKKKVREIIPLSDKWDYGKVV